MLPGQEQQIPHNCPDFVIRVRPNKLQAQRNFHPPDLTNSLFQQNQDPRQSEIQLHWHHTEPFSEASPSIYPVISLPNTRSLAWGTQPRSHSETQERSQAAPLQRMFLPGDIATRKDTGQIFNELTNGEMELQQDSETGKTQQSHPE